MYSNPRCRPVDHEVIQTYDPELTRDPEAYDPGRYDKEQIQVRDYDDTLAYLASLYPQKGCLVEVGCGTGFLLKKFQEEGWDVFGVEPDEGLCDFVRHRQELRAIATTLEEAGIPDASVDVVVMLHVIEHLADPLATMLEVFRILKPGGHLVIETPRYDSLAFAALGRRERSISCDGHIFFFTTGTLQRLCEKAGFKRRQLRMVGRSLSLKRVVWNLIIMSKSQTVERVIRKLLRGFKLNGTYVRINIRDMQRMVVQKV
jgi:SAM-dependent methyltransferase